MKGQNATPENGDEFEELLHDTGRLGDALQDGTFPGLVKNYIAKFTDKNEEMTKQFQEQLQLGRQQALQDWEQMGMRPKPGAGAALSNRDARMGRSVANSNLPDAKQQVAKQKLFNPAAMGACVDDEDYSQSLGTFIHAVYVGEHKAQKRGDTEAVAKYQDYKTRLHNALSERIPAEGGFLVPEVLRSEILMVSLEKAIVRPRARIIPMDSLRVPL